MVLTKTKRVIDIKTTKLIFPALLAVSMIFSPAYAREDVRVYVNSMRLTHEAFIEDGKTYIPLRAVGEALGAEVSWDDASRSAYISFTEEDMIAKVVENASPSVVTLVGNYAGEGSTVKFNNPTMHGSGVIYKSNGHIITNAHVVEDIKNLTVVLNDGTSLPARVLYSDEKSDLAIVKVDKLGLTPISMAPDESVLSGKTALAIGTPISLSMRNTVTKGIVCGTGVSLPDSYYKLIQTDATVNPGNSGGPLLNSKGELIGINSSKYVSVGIDNMAFAIPADTVKYVISQYEQYGYIKRPSINISLEQSWEAKIGLPTKKGLTVKSSSVQRIHTGDIINAVNGIDVHSITDWNEAIKYSYNGQSLIINITRNGETYDIEVSA